MATNSSSTTTTTRTVTAEELKSCLRDLMTTEDNRIGEAATKLNQWDTEQVNYEVTDYGSILEEILTEWPIRQVRWLPRLLNIFASKQTYQPSITDSLAKCLKNCARLIETPRKLHQILYAIDEGHYIQSASNLTNLGTAVVEVLSWLPVLPCTVRCCLRCKNNLCEIANRWRDINHFLLQICNHNQRKNADGMDCTMACLGAVYTILSDPKREKDVSPALTCVLDLFQEGQEGSIPDFVLKIKTPTQGNNDFTRMLSVLCRWMVLPDTRNRALGNKLFHICFSKMRDREKTDFADKILGEIFSNLLDSIETRKDEDMAFVLSLMISLRSIEVYHRIRRELACCLVGEYNENMEILVKMINFFEGFVDFNFTHHPRAECEFCRSYVFKVQEWKLDNKGKGFPELTKDVRALQSSEKMEISIGTEFSYTSYTSQYNSTTSNDNGSESSYSRYLPSTSRQTNSKVGLSNLGNTCYMNSVLQALVMTRQLCHEVLLYKPSNSLTDQVILEKLQHLFALLKYSKKMSLYPNEILNASRPSYFTPGFQQDSSEFLCHLLDMLYEQEKSATGSCSNSDKGSSDQSKADDRPMEDIEEGSPLDVPMDDDSVPIKRWTTEENLSEESSLQRKTHSLADFNEDLSSNKQTNIERARDALIQSQNLSDSHSDSTDSGIQSVGGEDSSIQIPLVRRVFGAEMKVTYKCLECNTQSHNLDKSWDIQLCFSEDNQYPKTVQELLDNYFKSENLKDDNKYHCDKCAKLCEGERWSTVHQAPSHLILTLKHFRYNSLTRLRKKLNHKITYNEKIELPLENGEKEVYRIYAAVVHAGYSLDYGHYYTYACDSKRNWYKFNDSFVYDSSFDDFKSLSPPNTPYILFYTKCVESDSYEEDAPPLTTLSKPLQEYIDRETSFQNTDYTKNSSPNLGVKNCISRNDSDNEEAADISQPNSEACVNPVTVNETRFTRSPKSKPSDLDLV